MLARATASHQHRAVLAALDRIMIRGRSFVLDTWADLLCPQVWALEADGAVLGHVLTISDDALQGAADWLVASLADALDEIWSDAGERGAWRGVYIDALQQLAHEATAVEQALVDRDVLREVAGLGPADSKPKRQV